MEIGPVEYAVIAFPGNRFNGEIVPALAELVNSGIVHILDVVFIKKDADGNVIFGDLDTVDVIDAAVFDEIDYEVDGLASEDDILLAASQLEPNSSAALIVWENTWATRLAQAIRNANGTMIANERIPHDLAQAAWDVFEQIADAAAGLA